MNRIGIDQKHTLKRSLKDGEPVDDLDLKPLLKALLIPVALGIIAGIAQYIYYSGAF